MCDSTLKLKRRHGNERESNIRWHSHFVDDFLLPAWCNLPDFRRSTPFQETLAFLIFGEHYDLLHHLHGVGCDMDPYQHCCRAKEIRKSWFHDSGISSRGIEGSSSSEAEMFKGIWSVLFLNQKGDGNENCLDRPCGYRFRCLKQSLG